MTHATYVFAKSIAENVMHLLGLICLSTWFFSQFFIIIFQSNDIHDFYFPAAEFLYNLNICLDIFSCFNKKAIEKNLQ